MLFFAYWVNTGEDWDYKKGGHTEYDPFGNYNFGATGRAAGFSADLLRRMSAFVGDRDDIAGSGQPSIFQALFGAGYPENPFDRGNYSAGIQYYDNKCYQR